MNFLNDVILAIASRSDLLFYLLVFAGAVMGTMVIGTIVTTAYDIRRRVAKYPGDGGRTERSLETLAGGAATGLFGKLLPADEAAKSQLRRFLDLAGFYGRHAPVVYQLVRIATAVLLGLSTALSYRTLFPGHPFLFQAAASMAMTALGYFLPRSIVSLRRDGICEEHRQGFPDFLDLLVICADAGVGIESAIGRLHKELSTSYPSLARNLHLMTLELRAGRQTREALDNLSLRLGIDEARSFATLMQQSEELGSSLVQSLRVYSDEMRSKRLVRAEEKAQALPAKLVIPLGLCIFPVILGVTLLPVAIAIYKALGI